MVKRQEWWCEAAQTVTLLDNILVQDSAQSPPFTQFFRVDARYAKHLKLFGEMCVVADTDNKVGRTKIDPRGKISLFVGYRIQHAGDVYRLLNLKTNRVIHSRDVKWIGKAWAEFYKIRMTDCASGHVDPDECFQHEEEDHDNKDDLEPENDSEPIQVIQPQAEELRDPLGEVELDEPIASSRVIHSRDVKWICKMWAEFYKIKMIDRASGYVHPEEDFQLEEEEDQDIDEEESEPEEHDSDAIQVG